MAQKKLLHNLIDECNVLLMDEYAKAIKSLYADLVDMYATICDEDDTPLISHLYSYNRYYKLIDKLNRKMNELGADEEKTMSYYLEKLYHKNETLLNREFNLSTRIDDETLKRIISEDWVGDGSNFSDRIWKDKTNMVKKLKSDLMQSIIRGDSPLKYSDTLKKYLVNEGYYPTARLLRTEMARVQHRATINKYKEAGITKVRIISANDERTCDACKERHNKVLDIDKVGDVLMHPQCRCSIVPVIE